MVTTIVRRNRDEDPEMEETAPSSGGVLRGAIEAVLLRGASRSLGSTQSGYGGSDSSIWTWVEPNRSSFVKFIYLFELYNNIQIYKGKTHD